MGRPTFATPQRIRSLKENGVTQPRKFVVVTACSTDELSSKVNYMVNFGYELDGEETTWSGKSPSVKMKKKVSQPDLL
jgi:hypothetical protein